jgi:hypothetical protein
MVAQFQKDNRTRILRIIYENLAKRRPTSEIGDPERKINSRHNPDPGVRIKAPDPDLQHWPLTFDFYFK